MRNLKIYILLIMVILFNSGCSFKMFEKKEPVLSEEQQQALYEEKIKNNTIKYLKQENPNKEMKNQIFIDDNGNWTEVKIEDVKDIIKTNYFDITKNHDFDKDRDISVILKREEYKKHIVDLKIIWTKEFVLKFNILPLLKSNNITKYKLYKYIDNEHIYNKNIMDNVFYVVVFDENFFTDETYKKIENYNKNHSILNEMGKKDVFNLSMDLIKENFLYSIHDDNFLYYEYLKNFKSLKYDLYYNTSNITNKEFNSFFLSKYSQINNENFMKYFNKKIKTYYLFYEADFLDLPFFDLVKQELEETKNILIRKNYISKDDIEQKILENEKLYESKINKYNQTILLENQFSKLAKQINLYRHTVYINVDNKMLSFDILLDDTVRTYVKDDYEVKLNKNILNVINFYLKNKNFLVEIPLISSNIAKELIKGFNIEKPYEEYYYLKNSDIEILIVK